MIIVKKNKPSLLVSFKKYLKEETEREEERIQRLSHNPNYLRETAIRYCGRYSTSTDDDYGYYDDYLQTYYKKHCKTIKKGEQTLDYLYNKTNKKYNNRGKHGGKKRKCKNRFNDVKNIFQNDVSLEDKTIYYYRDFNNPDNYEAFFNLHEFDQFLKEEGVHVNQNEISNLMTRDVSHCCINPDIQSTHGTVQLITDSSYGGLYWTCCSANSFSEDNF